MSERMAPRTRCTHCNSVAMAGTWLCQRCDKWLKDGGNQWQKEIPLASLPFSLPEFETKCSKCDGGEIERDPHRFEPCTECEGTGYKLTPDGERATRFILNVLKRAKFRSGD